MALYPPIIASSMPAFNVNDGQVKIYFSFPKYNSISDIQEIHLTLRYQVSNTTALNNQNDILVISKNNITKATDNTDRYYFILQNNFQANVLYKTQIRFSSSVATNPLGEYLKNNISNFSEWSTVCLLKPINIPTFTINGLGPTQTTINNFLADFTGTYLPGNSNQILKSWKLTLKQGNTQLCNSDWILVSAYNYNPSTNGLIVSYSLPYQFSTGITYTLIAEALTKNDYYISHTYTFNYSTSVGSFNNNSSLTTAVNEEEGYIKIEINLVSESSTHFILRRTSSKDNYLKYEDLRYYNHSGGNQTYTYYDFTAESGIFYRYIIQKVNNKGQRGPALRDQITKSDSQNIGYGTIGQWEYAYLLQNQGDGSIDNIKQLKLKFDLQISSFNINISESKTDTIGGKYPFIRRNGNMYYRSFPISGTISVLTDQSELFISQEQLNENLIPAYAQFRGNINYYIRQYDFTQERKFREAVQEFLFNSKPKLYKSMQEGNIIIKLMDISLSPKQQLNRLIYTFSATAYEIDQPTIKNYIKYGIIETGGN